MSPHLWCDDEEVRDTASAGRPVKLGIGDFFGLAERWWRAFSLAHGLHLLAD